MPEAFEVLIPLLNPNEPEVQVVEVLVENGQKVSPGDVLCVVETTKSSLEVNSEQFGFVVSLQAARGDHLRAGERLCWLAERVDWSPPVESDAGGEPVVAGVEAGIRITQPALELAKASGYPLDKLPGDRLVTKAEMQLLLSNHKEQRTADDLPMDPSALLIYGGGGHGKALIDLVRTTGSYQVVGIIDDGIPQGHEVMGIPVLGGVEQLSELAQKGVRQAINAVGGIGDLRSRIQVFRNLQARSFEFPNLTHPTAWIEASANLREGIQIFPHAYVGSEAQLGFGVIVNTSAVISHDCVLEDYVNVAPGALIAGNVTVGEGVLIGMGVTVNLNVRIGSGAKIGNSAVVKADVPVDQVVRAGSIWPPDTDREKTRG